MKLKKTRVVVYTFATSILVVGLMMFVPAWAWIQGDMNCDGRFDNFDIDPFVLALTEPADYTVQYPQCSVLNGDFDHDGRLTNFDIDPFLEALSAGPSPECSSNQPPQPTLQLESTLVATTETLTRLRGFIYDPDSHYDTLTVHWNFGDGTHLDLDHQSQSIETQHAYAQAGSYELIFTVVDPCGSFQSVSQRIFVYRPQRQFSGRTLDSRFLLDGISDLQLLDETHAIVSTRFTSPVAVELDGSIFKTGAGLHSLYGNANFLQRYGDLNISVTPSDRVVIDRYSNGQMSRVGEKWLRANMRPSISQGWAYTSGASNSITSFSLESNLEDSTAFTTSPIPTASFLVAFEAHPSLPVGYSLETDSNGNASMGVYALSSSGVATFTGVRTSLSIAAGRLLIDPLSERIYVHSLPSFSGLQGLGPVSIRDPWHPTALPALALDAIQSLAVVDANTIAAAVGFRFDHRGGTFLIDVTPLASGLSPVIRYRPQYGSSSLVKVHGNRIWALEDNGWLHVRDLSSPVLAEIAMTTFESNYNQKPTFAVSDSTIATTGEGFMKTYSHAGGVTSNEVVTSGQTILSTAISGNIVYTIERNFPLPLQLVGRFVSTGFEAFAPITVDATRIVVSRDGHDLLTVGRMGSAPEAHVALYELGALGEPQYVTSHDFAPPQPFQGQPIIAIHPTQSLFAVHNAGQVILGSFSDGIILELSRVTTETISRSPIEMEIAFVGEDQIAVGNSRVTIADFRDILRPTVSQSINVSPAPNVSARVSGIDILPDGRMIVSGFQIPAKVFARGLTGNWITSSVPEDFATYSSGLHVMGNFLFNQSYGVSIEIKEIFEP